MTSGLRTIAATLLLTMTGAVGVVSPVGAAASPASVPVSVPWLIIDPASGYTMARYGYRERATDRVVIAPTWADARPFQNGFAVVGKRQVDYDKPTTEIRYGVIDAHGNTVIPPEYDGIELVTRGRLTIAFLRRQYNAWWRFWQWHAPSLLGPSPPITRVLRDHWRVITLPDQKELLSVRLGYQQSLGFGYHRRFRNGNAAARAFSVIPFALHLSTASGLFSIGSRLFKMAADGTVDQVSEAFASFSQDGGVLVHAGDDGHYALIGPDGHRMPQKLTVSSATLHDTHGAALTPRLVLGPIGKQFWWAQFPSGASNPGNFRTDERLLTSDFTPRFPFIRQRPFYRDKAGHLYLAPDFHTPLPATLYDYAGRDGTFTAAQIIGHARLIVALPHGMGFLLATDDEFAQPGRAFILNPDGSWNMKAPAFLRAPTRVFADGRIVFVGRGSRGVLNTDLSFSRTPLISTSPVAGKPAWYLGQDEVTRKYGVYDAAHQRWHVPPHYDYLAGELVPGIAVYRSDEIATRNGTGFPERHFGLLDIAKNKAVTPALYDFVDTDGRVGQHRRIVNSYGVKLDPGFVFYLDPRTGKQFVSTTSTHENAGPAPGASNQPGMLQ